MNKTKTVILPLPQMDHLLRQWNRVMPKPLDCLPGGVRDLACAALQNQSDIDQYVEDVMMLLEEWANDDVEYAVGRRVARFMKNQTYLFMLEIMLQAFHEQFLDMVLPIFGDEKLYLKRVVSYHNAAGICVELSNEPTARFSYCAAR